MLEQMYGQGLIHGSYIGKGWLHSQTPILSKEKNENKSSACTEMMDIAHYFRYIEV